MTAAPASNAPLPVSLEPDILVDIVDGLARAEPLWRPHVAHDPTERIRLRLLATPAYEVWLLGWTPGQSVGLHDHGDANGAFVVVDGELIETTLDAGCLTSHSLTSGDFGQVPAGVPHDVANRSDRNATSIHAYSHPLRVMGFYRDDGSLARVEAVHEQSTLLDDTAGSPPIAWRALHSAVARSGTIAR